MFPLVHLRFKLVIVDDFKCRVIEQVCIGSVPLRNISYVVLGASAGLTLVYAKT